MLILLDDIKLRSAEEFFPYISKCFSLMDNLDTFYDVLSEYEGDIEFVVNDFDEIDEDGRKFANGIMKILLDMRNQNKNVKLTMM